MTSDRASVFRQAQELSESDKTDEAIELLAPITSDKENELSLSEMQTLSNILTDKITSASFDSKKEACYQCIDILEGMKLAKDISFLVSYAEAAYDAFSKINRSAREEERENVWCRAKEMYLEIFSAVRKAVKEKNDPERLEIFLSFSKLSKSYLDVVDMDSLTICEDAARDGKFAGKGTLDDEDWKDVKRTIEQINKLCSDARHERKLLDDE